MPVRDNEQKQLRDRKKAWSKNMSKLISALIAYKRGLNGNKDDNFSIPATTITNKLPKNLSSLTSFLDATANFSKLVSESASIFEEQNNYADLYKNKKQNKKAYAKQQLEKYSSNIVSRFTKGLAFANPFSSNPNKHKYYTFLKKSWELFKVLQHLESTILGTSTESLKKSITIFTEDVNYLFKQIRTIYNSVVSKEVIPEDPINDTKIEHAPQGKKQEVLEEINYANRLMNTLNVYLNSNILSSLFNSLNNNQNRMLINYNRMQLVRLTQEANASLPIFTNIQNKLQNIFYSLKNIINPSATSFDELSSYLYEDLKTNGKLEDKIEDKTEDGNIKSAGNLNINKYWWDNIIGKFQLNTSTGLRKDFAITVKEAKEAADYLTDAIISEDTNKMIIHFKVLETKIAELQSKIQSLYTEYDMRHSKELEEQRINDKKQKDTFDRVNRNVDRRYLTDLVTDKNRR